MAVKNRAKLANVKFVLFAGSPFFTNASSNAFPSG